MESVLSLGIELLGRCLLTMQARKPEVPEVGNQPPATISEVTYAKATASRDSTIRDTLGSSPNAS